MSNNKLAAHFGAGNIGRGFIGKLLSKSGYKVMFIDVQENIINAIKSRKQYEVRTIIGNKIGKTETIKNIDGFLSTPDNQDALNEIILHSNIVSTAVGPSVLSKIAPALARALDYRFTKNKDLLNIIACENMVGASDILKSEVLQHIKNKHLLQERVGFPNSCVERIVVTNPKYTGQDSLTVCVEEYREWGIDSNAYIGDKAELSQATFIDNIAAHAEKKLFTLNTGHAMMAYLGYLYGCKTIHDTINQKHIFKYIFNAMHESKRALIKKWAMPETEINNYIDLAIERVGNPLLEDDVVRVGREVIRKIGPTDRLVYPLNLCADYQLPRENLIIGLAAALHFDATQDKSAQELQTIIREKGLEYVLVEISKVKNKEDITNTIEVYKRLKSQI